MTDDDLLDGARYGLMQLDIRGPVLGSHGIVALTDQPEPEGLRTFHGLIDALNGTRRAQAVGTTGYGERVPRREFVRRHRAHGGIAWRVLPMGVAATCRCGLVWRRGRGGGARRDD